MVLLQGTALKALQDFFTSLRKCKAKGVTFDALLSALLTAGQHPDTARTAQQNIAQCIAMLCTSAGSKQTKSTVNSLLSALQSGNEAEARLALFTLGALGRLTDLTSYGDLQQLLVRFIGSGSEETKGAASHALGGLALGNLQGYLPFIMQQIQQQASTPNQQYLLLRSLNEAIVGLASKGDTSIQLPHLDQVSNRSAAAHA